MKKITLLTFTLFLNIGNFLFAQSLNWAYSIKHKDNVQDNLISISSNGSNRFVIIGANTKTKSLDLKDPASLEKATEEGFIAVYDASATLLWHKPMAMQNGFIPTAYLVLMNAQNEVFVCGKFSGTLDFDPGSGETKLTASSEGDIYLQKFNANGSFAWAAQLGNGGNPGRLIQLANGNILLGGIAGIPSTITVGGNPVNLKAGLYLAEFNSSGILQKAMSGEAKQPLNCNLNGLSQDAAGNIILSGYFDEWMDFDLGSGQANDTTISSLDAFVAKYDANYTLQWKKRFGDTLTTGPKGWDYARDNVIDAANNIYVCGYFTKTTDFDPDANPRVHLLTSSNSSQQPNGFIMKYNASGNLQWVKSIGRLSGTSINTDLMLYHMKLANNNLYCTGTFVNQADLNPDATDTTVFRGYGNTGQVLFFAQYDLDGKYKTAIAIDDTVADQFAMTSETSSGIELLNNTLISAGTFQKGVDFDPTANQSILSCDKTGPLYSFDKDIYVASYTFSGGSNGLINRFEPSQIKVYPNPTKEKIFVEAEASIKQLSLINLNGQILIQENASHELDCRTITAGIYLLKIDTEQGRSIRKIIIE